MYGLGLSAANQAAFHALLASHHTIEVQLTIMDMDHNEKTDVTNRLIDGQVTVDADAQVTRALTLDLLDPNGALHLDSRSPDEGAMFADRMVRVRYCVINPTATFRVNVPVFTGPITKLERNGAAVRVECAGKEMFGLARAWNTKSFQDGYKVTSAIIEILRDVMGETHIEIGSRSDRLPRNVSVGDDKLPWDVAKKLAESIGFQLYFDGQGHACMRRRPENVSFVFHEGRGGSLKSKPTAGFNIDNLINAVEVFGKKPEKDKGKKQPHAVAIADRTHPLSPWALGRSGGPRYLPVVIEDDALNTDQKARDRADSELRWRLRSSVDMMYDTLVIPHLEELDVVHLSSERVASTHVLKKFAIPLTAGGTATVGYVKNVKVNKSAIKQLQRRQVKAAG